MGKTANKELFIGLMSGTSVDGIDAALVEFDSERELRVMHSEFTPFDRSLRERINALAQANSDLRHRGDSPLHQELAGHYARASLSLLSSAKVDAEDVAGLANHGQTVRHEPNAAPPFSLQLGDPQLIANLSGITTYAQFRQADLGAGGQGAPLMPAFHKTVFSGDESSFVLNIGGIANITQLGDKIIGFDTGPGNTLLDQWIVKHQGASYDKDGDWARTGKVIPTLLERWQEDPYFKLSPPKSTGPDYFNLAWLGDLASFSPNDVQASLLALTVSSIADSLNSIAAPQGEQRGKVYICGGGAQNSAMMEDIAAALNYFDLQKTDALGVPSDWVEAVGFAWLGYCCKHGINSSLPSVTGAREACVLGEVYYPKT